MVRFVRPAFVAAILVLAGCNTPPPVAKFPDITYSHMSPIQLDVKRIEVVWAYAPPYSAPNVDHLFPTPPGKAAERWATDRLKAVGKEGYARFIIRDASVIETRLRKTGGVAGAFTTDQAARYDGVIDVELQLQDDLGQRDGKVFARATMTQTAPENATINQTEQIWFDMTEAMMKQINAQLETNIQTHLRPFLR